MTKKKGQDNNWGITMWTDLVSSLRAKPAEKQLFLETKWIYINRRFKNMHPFK